MFNRAQIFRLYRGSNILTENTTENRRPLTVVTGASSGIGLELAKCCARDGFDLLIAAGQVEIEGAAEQLKTFAGSVEAVQTYLSTNGSKAFIDSFAATLHNELKDSLVAGRP